jgi:serine/threonine-protein kinase
MAQVWAACQHGARGFNRLVALKTVLPELAEPEFEALFLDEARLAARIHHRNVCEVFELVEDGGVLGLAMEWVDGDTLHALLNSPARRIDAPIAAHIVAEVASGLHAAHELRDEGGVPFGLVHRDVSPHNVLISRDGRVKVTDFGVAKAVGASREQTASGQIRGKLNYLSPEQARGEPLDRRSDVFSLGVLLYVATVAAHPFSWRDRRKDQQVVNLLIGRLTPPSAVVPDYPEALEAIVMKALRHDPNERFATADEMRRELVGWLTRAGLLVGDEDIARVLHERRGSSIEQRTEQIGIALRASRERRATSPARAPSPQGPGASGPAQGASVGPGVAVPSAPAPEPTAVLTGALRARRRDGRRRSLRLALLVIGAAGLGGLGALALTPPSAGPRAAAPAAAPAEQQPASAEQKPPTTSARLPDTSTTLVQLASTAAADATGSDDGAPAKRVAPAAATSTARPIVPAKRARPNAPRAVNGSLAAAPIPPAPASIGPGALPRGRIELGPRENEL